MRGLHSNNVNIVDFGADNILNFLCKLFLR